MEKKKPKGFVESLLSFLIDNFGFVGFYLAYSIDADTTLVLSGVSSLDKKTLRIYAFVSSCLGTGIMMYGFRFLGWSPESVPMTVVIVFLTGLAPSLFIVGTSIRIATMSSMALLGVGEMVYYLSFYMPGVWFRAFLMERFGHALEKVSKVNRTAYAVVTVTLSVVVFYVCIGRALIDLL